MTRELGGVDANILKMWKSDNTICDDDNRLTAAYWILFDKLDYHSHDNPYEMLKAVTPPDTIKRSRRWLHENSYIKYHERVEKAREKRYKEETERYSNTDVYAAMREKLKKEK